jgi:predicted nucleotidyltransferase
MGAKILPSTGLAGALFAGVQQRVLALLFGQPERSFYASELIRLAGSGTGAVQRELARLVDSGLVTRTQFGNQKHYQANPESPVFEELHGIVVKTVGLVGPLRDALACHAKKIRAAFVYGSVAKGGDTSRSDIDLMIIGNGLAYRDVFAAMQKAEAILHRPINPNLMTLAEWRRKLAARSQFVTKIDAQAKIFIVGSQNDLAGA